MSLSGKRILLGVTGGIAAYKSVILLRELQNLGAEVRCIATPSAFRFIGKDTLASLTRMPVPSEVFPDDGDISDNWSRHVHWAEWADLFVIAPCTANTLSKIACGISDNMLTTTVLAARCPVLLCPTMDGGMYQSPAVRRNLKMLKNDGYHILEPDHGYLASGLHDTGRLPETAAIISSISSMIPDSPGPLNGKKVLVTAGPTREHLDPVRFLSNPSTGKMGFAMAEAAAALGADVTLIHGPVSIKAASGMKTESITSTHDLFEAVKKHSDSDVVIMAAAVSDFTPKTVHSGKVKKDAAENAIEFERTPDILTWLGDNRKDGQVLIGFAMETENLLPQAREKRKKKKADFILANELSGVKSGFETDQNVLYLIGEKTESDPPRFEGSKKEIARQVLKSIFS